jgi:hypothetical protein
MNSHGNLMIQNRLTYAHKLFLCFVAAFSFLNGDSLLLAQETAESSAPRIDILTMNGSKPSLSPAGEGISYYKIGDLFERGTTQVKPFDGSFKIELPVGYTLFKTLAYIVESTAVFTGPCDIEFVVPSTLTKESFDKLRILYAEYDEVDPEKPKWVDITLDDSISDRLKEFISPSEIRSRQPNFKARTIHAFTEWTPKVLVVALRDTSKTREMFTADLIVSGTAAPQVTEGRVFTTNLKVTNLGPATATSIVLSVDETRELVSATSTQGTCRQSAQSVYCKFPSLEPNQSIQIKIVQKCPWFGGVSSASEGATSHPILRKVIDVEATEKDPLENNNQIQLGTELFFDSNKGPVVESLGPEQFEVFPGPAASVPMRVKASDPDGLVSKVEFFEEGQLIGAGSLKAENEYELLYRNVPFGRHITAVKVTDNLGRETSLRMPDFFVNGLANVEITNPRPGGKVKREDGDILITIHATHPSLPLKQVSLNVWGTDATPIGNDDYLVHLKFCTRKCRLQARAIDQNGVETKSQFSEFVLTESPETTLQWFDGEYIQQFDSQTEFKVNELVLVGEAQYKSVSSEAALSKMEYFVDGNLICTKGEQEGGFFDSSKGCIWKIPSSGQYKLQAVATDEDGMVGRSRVVEVTIQKP